MTGFDLYPAIDLRDGRCVRLLRGDFSTETVYDDDPVAVARRFETAGARWIHVVDLDAARTGSPTALRTIEAICAAVGCRVQAGGGVRSVEAAGALLGRGVDRVVLGTAAIEHPELIGELAAAHPGAIAAGLDARGRAVAARGWELETGEDLVDLAERFEGSGAAALVVTEIARDGTMAGPDLAQLELVLAATTVPVIASGGVGTLDDVRALRDLRVGERRLSGAIVGRALYEGRFQATEAFGLLGDYGRGTATSKGAR